MDDDDGGYDEDLSFEDERFDDSFDVDDFEENLSSNLSGSPPDSQQNSNSYVKQSKGGINVDLSEFQKESWTRPAVPPFTPTSHSITVQTVDIDYTIGTPVTFPSHPSPHAPGTSQKAAIVRLFGVDNEGHSVLVHIHNLLPYFYVMSWPGFTQQDLNLFASSLNDELKSQARADQTLKRFVMTVQHVKRQSIWGYNFDSNNDYLKITLAIPALIPTARRLCENGISVHGQRRQFVTYESNLPYVLRFMVDNNVKGGGWIEVKQGEYTVRSGQNQISRAQIEVDCDFRSIIAHEAVGQYLTLAPMRILSLDIECEGRKGHFPTADIDKVIQIACAVSSSLSIDKPFCKVIFTLKSCAPIVGTQVIACEEERDVLMRFVKFFVTVDPDIITGYNIINFDLPYLLDRAKTLKLADFAYFGRINNAATTMKNAKFESKAYGIRESKEIKIEGRVQFDCLDVIRREHKLRSYTLNSVCAVILGQQKEDVHHSIITDLQNGNEETRRRLAVYCMKDAELPLRLMEKLMLVVNFVEMARVTGVPITYLLTRGQQIKVISQLYRKARQHNLVIPVRKMSPGEESYEGATVIEPKKAYYQCPIATLDFASLYPSIMIAHNLCYSTLLQHNQISRLQPDEYVKTPNGDYFVTTKKKRGLLPEILVELLEARSQAKKMMKQAKDPFEAAVLNGRQLALKISANSVYGFTGATVGQLPCLPISSSVTAFGRTMIELAKSRTEEAFSIANGYTHNAEVIYGDTDSIMVKFGCDDVETAMKLGAEAAALISQSFISPIRLEFEKVYYPYLLMNKKRYAGLYWSKPDHWDKMDTKGIETVRRDNCALVSNVVTECLNLILIERSPNKAIDYVKRMISDLLTNRLDLSLLVISKSLGKSAHSDDYKAKQAHVELAERMRKRDPSSAPAVGDRVAYVITKAPKGAPAYEKAEDPIFVLENDLPIDTNYYLANQLTQPLQRLFEPILSGDKLRTLFAGDHTRSIKVIAPSSGGIVKFAIKTKTCVGCKVPLGPNEKSLCVHCKVRAGELYVKQVEKVRVHEELYTRVWTQCQRCQGSLHQDVLCTSRDCPIFYRRKKVQKDLNEAQGNLDKFDF